jgi:hypothetical protein
MQQGVRGVMSSVSFEEMEKQALTAFLYCEWAV